MTVTAIAFRLLVNKAREGHQQNRMRAAEEQWTQGKIPLRKNGVYSWITIDMDYGIIIRIIMLYT